MVWPDDDNIVEVWNGSALAAPPPRLVVTVVLNFRPTWLRIVCSACPVLISQT
ncbi:hypothetical protein N8561_01330 [bacterium]|nr:hypothetical protein [Synechococcus sp. AH-551-C10]MDA7677510.1 hypothetical protein [bacterium]